MVREKTGGEERRQREGEERVRDREKERETECADARLEIQSGPISFVIMYVPHYVKSIK